MMTKRVMFKNADQKWILNLYLRASGHTQTHYPLCYFLNLCD